MAKVNVIDDLDDVRLPSLNRKITNNVNKKYIICSVLCHKIYTTIIIGINIDGLIQYKNNCINNDLWWFILVYTMINIIEILSLCFISKLINYKFIISLVGIFINISFGIVGGLILVNSKCYTNELQYIGLLNIFYLFLNIGIGPLYLLKRLICYFIKNWQNNTLILIFIKY